MFGTSAFAAPTFAGPTVVEFTHINVPDKPNFLQVRTSAGVLLHRLDGWFDAEVTLKANTPGQITFSIPLTHPAVADSSLVSPNEIWWYDSGHNLRRKFIIQEEEITIDGTSYMYKVYGEDYLVKLANETNDVTGSDSPMTVSSAITAILNAQVNGTPVQKGYIAPALSSLSISFPDQSGNTFLSMLNEIRKQDVGGYFGVDSSNRLNWYAYSTVGASLVLNMQSNLNGYSERRKSAKLVNRVYVSGAMTATGRIACSSPGYVEDTASQATYGLRSHRISNSRIKTQAAADAIAQMYLEAHSAPPVARTFPVIDTQALKRGTMLTDEEVNETIYIGAGIKLRIPAIAPSSPFLDDVISTNVTGVKRNLAEFAQIEVTVGDVNGDVDTDGDLFDSIAETASESGSNNDQDTQDLLDLIPNNHTDLDDCAASIGTAGQLVKVNTGATAHDYTTGGAAGGILKRNTGNTSPEWLAIGSAGQVLKVNAGATSPEWGAASASTVTVSSTLSGLGTSSDAGFGEVTADGNNEGLWFFPDAGTVNADWRQIVTLIQATSKTNLGNPGRFSLGWVTTVGSEYGLWQYPPNGTANSDWMPVNLYSTAA